MIGTGIAGRNRLEVRGERGQGSGCGLTFVQYAGLLFDAAQRLGGGCGLFLGRGGNDLGALLRLARGRFGFQRRYRDRLAALRQHADFLAQFAERENDGLAFLSLTRCCLGRRL